MRKMWKPGEHAGDKNPAYRHGHAMRRRMSAEYLTWARIIQRCTNKRASNFRYYGGRGIKVCDRWRSSFESFLEDVGSCPSAHHSIERIDNARGYEPGNVRWATKREQARNRRRAHLITFRGVTKCAAEWAEETGLDQIVIVKRIRRGWTPEQALTLPLQKSGPRVINGWTKRRAS